MQACGCEITKQGEYAVRGVGNTRADKRPLLSRAQRTLENIQIIGLPFHSKLKKKKNEIF